MHLVSITAKNQEWLDSVKLLLNGQVDGENGLDLEYHIERNIRDTFRSLHSSLLSGEYFLTENFDEVLTEFQRTVNHLQDHSTLIPKETSNNYECFVQVIKKAYSLYNSLYLHVLTSKTPYDKIIYETVLSDPFTLTHFSSEIKDFEYHINLTKIDHFISSEHSIVEQLMSIRMNLRGDEPIRKLIIEKCDFLLKKVFIRVQETKIVYKNIHQGKVEDFQASTSLNNLASLLPNVFDQKSELDWSSKIKVFEREIKQISYENIDLRRFQSAFFYFKSNLKYVERARGIFEVFQKIKQSSVDQSNDHDRLVFDLAECYFSNQILNMYLSSSKDVDSKDKEDWIDLVLELHEEREIPNFYPYKKICQYRLKILGELFAGEPETKLVEIQKQLTKVKVAVQKLKDTIFLCKEKNFIQFRLPLKDTKIKVNEIDLFVFSGNSIPINYQEEGLTLSKIEAEYMKYSSMYEVVSHMKRSRDVIDDIKSVVEKSERSSIEILGIFSAIIVFSFGSLDIFNKAATVKDAILFSTFFAHSLISFVVAIWFVTRQSLARIRLIHWCIAAFMFVSWLILFLFLIGKLQFENPSVNIKKEVLLEAIPVIRANS